jgi:ssDNA-binding Zn-finger/Zn-ribbon topoisomerase 1
MQNIQDPIYRRGIPAPLVASLSPIRPQVSSLICPRCGSPLRSETMRTGLFLECSTSPECLYSKYIDGKSGGA